MAPFSSDSIYSATYSNVPVYEFTVEGNHVMRRRCDDFINATHILKVAEYDKPARTRILEREVQKGFHEKIQGGYGKYQGTWIPLQDGKQLAERNGVLEKLRPIFDFVPGNVSPPQAPKHTTNVNRAKAPKQGPAARKAALNQAYSQMSDDYENVSGRLPDEDSQDNNSTIDSISFMDGDNNYGQGYMQGSRKRKRPTHQDVLDQQHTMYADALLDYFILSSSELPSLQSNHAPYPPENFQVDRPIDDQGHTALHWGAAMGDIEVVRHFLDRRATPGARNNRGETPLIRAVLFTNNYEKETMSRLVNLFSGTIRDHDDHNANVLHHIVMTTNSHAKRKCARYYLDVVLNKLAEVCTPSEFSRVLNHQDSQGDTPLHISARHNAKKCVRALQGRGVRGDIPNKRGETADQILQSLRSVHQDFISSSPVLPPNDLPSGRELAKLSRTGTLNHYHTESARSFSQSFESMVQEKSLQISLALDSELREKEEDLADSQKMLDKIENERSSVRQAMFLNFAQSGNENQDEVRALEEEEATLRAEGLALSEQLQHKELHHLVRAEEKLVPTEARTRPSGSKALSAPDVEQQSRAGLELAAEQHKRRKLTNTVVEAQGFAGMSQTGEALKRLVSTTMAVPADQVVELIPELLEELEQSKMDFSAELVAVA